MEMSTVEDVLESLARTQKGNVKTTIENFMTILYRDPVLKDAICKKELTNKIDIVKPLLWKRNGNSITDVDMYQMAFPMIKSSIRLSVLQPVREVITKSGIFLKPCNGMGKAGLQVCFHVFLAQMIMNIQEKSYGF